MSRRKNNDYTSELMLIFIGIPLLIIWLIKIFINLLAGLFKLIALILNKIYEIANKKKQKSTKSKNSNIRQLHIFDKSIYDDEFPPQIRMRGEKYYSENRINNFKKENNKYTCLINGTKEYNVSVTFKRNKIIDAFCTCPYFKDENHKCKHIYALVYKVKCHNNKEKIIKEIKEQLRINNKMINNSKNYISKNISNFTFSAIEDYSFQLYRFNLLFGNLESRISTNTLEDTLIKNYNDLFSSSLDLYNNIMRILNTENERKTSNYNNSQANRAAFDVLLLQEMIKKHKNKNNNKSLEEEMNKYSLEEWEKELVRNGEYDPWNFDEDEPEEGDYYYEDE